MRKIIISEEEKKQILESHANKGLTLSEKISDLSDEELDEEMDNELDEEMDNELDEEMEMDLEMDGEDSMYEKSTSDLEEEPLYELEYEDDEEPFEKGPRGMRGARTRADFDPTAREVEMSGVFGKHAEDVPPTTIRYMRKNPGRIIKRLADMYGIDKIKGWLDI